LELGASAFDEMLTRVSSTSCEFFQETKPTDRLSCPRRQPEQYREQIAELVEEIEAEARAHRQARGVEPLGVEAILRQDPHRRPNQTKKSPAPAYHAASKAARERFWESYSAFVSAFREAADKLKAGDRTARFPLGSFPPAMPFVSAYPSLPP
jgi:hypothetical protein